MAKGAERLPGTSSRIRTRDDGCCSVNFLKYVLHIYNVVLFLSGLVVGGIGVWTVIAKHNYISLMSTSAYPILAYALVAAGGLAVIGSWLGCGGVSTENRCVLLVVAPGIFSTIANFAPTVSSKFTRPGIFAPGIVVPGELSETITIGIGT